MSKWGYKNDEFWKPSSWYCLENRYLGGEKNQYDEIGPRENRQSTLIALLSTPKHQIQIYQLKKFAKEA